MSLNNTKYKRKPAEKKAWTPAVKKVIPYTPPPVRNWSQYQKDIFDNVANGTGHTVVIARAGSGKTSTIVQSLHGVPQGLFTVVVAFNKFIKDTLEPMVPPGTDVFTLHSLGLKACTQSFGKVKVEQWKSTQIVESFLGKDPKQREYSQQITKCASLAKACLTETNEEVDALIDDFGLDAGRGEARDVFIEHVQKTMKMAREQTDIVDFDDMIYLPNALDIKIPEYDRVFIDEAHDLNKSQIKFSLKACHKSGRICAVGDPKQAIYAWRGADAEAIPNIIKALNPTIFPLSITYRCAKAIVREANKIVPDIMAAENAPEGSVEHCSIDEMKELARPNDFILSRINAPLIGLAMSFLKKGILANIQGRDIGSNLISMIKKSKRKDVKSFLSYIHEWKEEEVDRLTKKKRDTTATIDRAECLISLAEGQPTLFHVQQNIERLFADTDDRKKIILSSVHKAKGLERDRVFLLNHTLRRGASVEEDNIAYVATTRAKSNLYLVNKG